MSTSSYHHGTVRETTLNVARQMLEDLPPQQISVRKVARAADISHAAPYKHFAQRSDFLAALAARCMREFIAAQVSAAQEAVDARDRLIRLGTAYVDYGIDHPHAFALIFDPEVSPPGAPPAELAALVDQHTSMLSDAVADGAKAGVLPDQVPPGDIATALWAQVHGLTQLVVLGHVERSRITDALGVLVPRSPRS